MIGRWDRLLIVNGSLTGRWDRPLVVKELIEEQIAEKFLKEKKKTAK